MTLYSYVVSHDSGFSPNPFFGYCTLACCKPEIRRQAQIDDWIIGLAPKAEGSHVTYLMRVDEVLDFDQYWRDPRFLDKRPRFDMDCRRCCGDNIYEPSERGGFRQIRSAHSDGDTENVANKQKDLAGLHVLVSETFSYFGSKGVDLPPGLRCLIAGRGHRSRFDKIVKHRFVDFAGGSPLGLHGPPRRWPPGDASWSSPDAAINDPGAQLQGCTERTSVLEIGTCRTSR